MLLLVIIMILSFLGRDGTGAIPIASPEANVLPVSTTPKTTRSAFDIFWSCWITIFICTWTSMHPNIAPSGQGAIRAVWRRITLMFWAFLVPELVLTWAVKQWLAARAIEKAFKKGTSTWHPTPNSFLTG